MSRKYKQNSSFFFFYSEKVKIKDTPIQLARSLYYELKSDFDQMELIFII
jgi:hypothetical protein